MLYLYPSNSVQLLFPAEFFMPNLCFFLDCASLRLGEALEIFAHNGERVGDVSPAFGFHVKNMSLGGGIALSSGVMECHGHSVVDSIPRLPDVCFWLVVWNMNVILSMYRES
jgi:hypothetical protein